MNDSPNCRCSFTPPAESPSLLGCPLCGSDVYVRETEFGYTADWEAKLRCPRCGTEYTLHSSYFGRPSLLEIWNTRPASPDSEELEQLRVENEELKARIEELERMSLF